MEQVGALVIKLAFWNMLFEGNASDINLQVQETISHIESNALLLGILHF